MCKVSLILLLSILATTNTIAAKDEQKKKEDQQLILDYREDKEIDLTPIKVPSISTISLDNLNQITNLSDLHHRSGGDYGAGNGGNAHFLKFASTLNSLIAFVENNSELFPEFSLQELKDVVEKTEVYFVTETEQTNLSFDAINYEDEGVIFFDILKWKILNEDERMGLLFHEYLGVLGLEKDNYHISSRITLGNRLERHLNEIITKQGLPYSKSKIECLDENETEGICKVFNLNKRDYHYIIIKNGEIEELPY